MRNTWKLPVVVDTDCDWVKPIYLTDHDIDILDRQTKKDILAHNKAWQTTVGEKNPFRNEIQYIRRVAN